MAWMQKAKQIVNKVTIKTPSPLSTLLILIVSLQQSMAL